MNESSQTTDGNPHEPPGSNPSVTVGKPERLCLQWYHWLAFFSPAMVSITFGVMMVREPGGNYGIGLFGLALGALLCMANGVRFARGRTRTSRVANGFLWILCGLAANSAVAWSGCLLVLR